MVFVCFSKPVKNGSINRKKKAGGANTSIGAGIYR
jgi:hypothetical protein